VPGVAGSLRVVARVVVVHEGADKHEAHGDAAAEEDALADGVALLVGCGAAGEERAEGQLLGGEDGGGERGRQRQEAREA
jgi:hypothetical protein